MVKYFILGLLMLVLTITSAVLLRPWFASSYYRPEFVDSEFTGVITSKDPANRYKRIVVTTTEGKEIIFSALLSSCFLNSSKVGYTVVKARGTGAVTIINEADTAFCEAYYQGE